MADSITWVCYLASLRLRLALFHTVSDHVEIFTKEEPEAAEALRRAK